MFKGFTFVCFAWKENGTNVRKEALMLTHTERQATHQAHQASVAVARSHWNPVHCDTPKRPRPIPKRQPKRQNFKAAADADARCVYTLRQKFRELK